MPYRLKAVIGGFDQLRSHTDKWTVAPLGQHMGLVPITKLRYEELTGSPPVLAAVVSPQQPFKMMSPAFEGTLSDWSKSGPLAYVEASFHGGEGYQSAALWRSGAQVWGPAYTWNLHGPWQGWPINEVLALLGVIRSDCGESHDFDLFLEVGLGQESDTDDWKWTALRTEWAADYDQWHQEQLAEHERRVRAAEEAEKYRRLPDVPVVLDGHAVMELLDIPPGPLVGAAIRHLQNISSERGSMEQERAVAELRTWAAEQDIR